MATREHAETPGRVGFDSNLFEHAIQEVKGDLAEFMDHFGTPLWCLWKDAASALRAEDCTSGPTKPPANNRELRALAEARGVLRKENGKKRKDPGDIDQKVEAINSKFLFCLVALDRP